MLYYRPAHQRGRANLGWLQSFHSFSFAKYFDPKHMGFSCLRVLNDDTVAGGAGFSTHGHRDMEIISYILEGAVEHEDTMGNKYVIPAGDIQRMSAGSGVMHSEYNASKQNPVKFLQIWIEPNVTGIAPEYEQKSLKQNGKLTTLISPDGRDGSLRIHQDALMYRVQLKATQQLMLSLNNRSGYLHLIEGDLQVDTENNTSLDLSTADGLGVNAITDLKVTAKEKPVTALWFDLPALTTTSE
jgi:redox-sensitive bicupin YhaK (pirin superfamily)